MKPLSKGVIICKVETAVGGAGRKEGGSGGQREKLAQ